MGLLILKKLQNQFGSELLLSTAHIAGRLNRGADGESRKTESRIEWKLNRTNFHNTLECLQYYPEIDFFASGQNAQLLRFFSYRPDPFSKATNAFSVSWEDFLLLYFCMHRQGITKTFCG